LDYKETLYFVAKCLTISLEEKNRQAIETKLQSTSIDWDAVVKLSTGHYVFPALYCNLQRANFLHYLPEELVAYMAQITQLNRDRNEQIITQAKALNALLLAHNITPIFLKGTGNLLAGLYEDIAERMVGDIDFIFSKEDYPKSITILREFGYCEVEKREYYFPDLAKHYRRLQKEKNIAAIEIHSELLDIKKYANEFNYSFVEKDSQLINGIGVLSYANKLNLSIIANQINDSGFYYKTMALRNAYDVFLLSKKTTVTYAFDELPLLKHSLTCFLATCAEVFGKPASLQFETTTEVDKYVATFYRLLHNDTKRAIVHKKIRRRLFIKARLHILYKTLFDQQQRTWLFKRISDKNWQREKLRQLGI
jgi:hypothetical protein